MSLLKGKLYKKLMSMLMIVSMVLLLIPSSALASDPQDISAGPVIITEPGDYTIIQSGIGSTTNTITVNTSGTANISIQDLNIQTGGCAFMIQAGSVNLTILGNNTLVSTESYAGIQNGNNQLTIGGTGQLVAQCATSTFGYGAGIGGGESGTGANITINGGTVTAIGGNNGSGIGGGWGANGNNITINGGHVIAAPTGWYGAGIGGGCYATANNITINGGTVEAYGAEYGAGIGGGLYGGNCSNIIIDGGSVKVIGGDINGSGKVADIGGGLYGGAAVTPVNTRGENVYLVTTADLTDQDRDILSTDVDGNPYYDLTDAVQIGGYYYLYLPQYSITYNNIESASNPNPDNYIILSDITLAAASKTGFAFDGWYDAETGGNQVTSIPPGSTGNKTLYARWTSPPSSDLTNIVLSGNPSNFNFNGANYVYNGVTVANEVNSITVTPTGAGTITVDGIEVASGQASGEIALIAGTELSIAIVATETGLSPKTYTINVTRALASDATLASLTVSSGTLTPAFDPVITSYTAYVGSNVKSITVSPTVSESHASATVNGTAVTSGQPSSPISLSPGSNNITVAVTAQDGTTVMTYTIDVIQGNPSSDARLSNLSLSSGTLTPAFKASKTSYTVSVAIEVNSIEVTPTVNEIHASVTVNGTAVTSGQPSSPISLNPGINNITIAVTAQDGIAIKIYTVNVIQGTLSSDATLSNLSISSGTLTPVFAPGTKSYTASVANAVSSITVTPTVNESHALVTVNGTAVTSGQPSAPVNLAVGKNKITAVITAQDGTIMTYSIIVTRAR